MNDQPIIRVAYADDHLASRESITVFISQSNMIEVCIQADNGQQLIERLEKEKQLPDVVILDINMHPKNGYDTQMELIQKWPQIKTLVLTAHPSEFSIIKMIMAGVKGYLPKSCHPREIEAAIVSIHKQGHYHSELADRNLFMAIENKQVWIPQFTTPEREVLKYCCTDLTYAEIAEQLGTTARSVEGHRDSLFKKLKVNSRITLARIAVELGIVPLELQPDVKCNAIRKSKLHE